MYPIELVPDSQFHFIKGLVIPFLDNRLRKASLATLSETMPETTLRAFITARSRCNFTVTIVNLIIGIATHNAATAVDTPCICVG